LDALSTAGVGIAFLFQLILDRTALAFLSPYVDPAIAVILAIFLLKEPLSMLKEALRNLVLFAPKEEVISHLYDVASTNLGEVEGTISFVDVIKTGRKMWVDIYFLPQKDSISMSALKQAQDNIHQILAKEYTSLYVKLIPETEAPVRPAPKQSPDKLRRR
ncbi:MAG: cation transporter, partial [Anaerovoracaceae bacterium]